MKQEIIALIKELSGDEIVFEHRIVVKASPHSPPVLIKKVNTNLEVFDIGGNAITIINMVIASIYQRLKLIQYNEKIRKPGI